MWGRQGRGIRTAPCVLGLALQEHPVTKKPSVTRGPHLISVIREVDLVENLGGFVLNGLHLHQVWGILPGPISENQEMDGGAVRRQQVHWAMGSREQGDLWSQVPILILSTTSYQVTVT